MSPLEDSMPARLEAARLRLQDSASPASLPGDSDPPEPQELRQVFRKFRQAMGALGNPGTIPLDGEIRAGWVISSGKVEGYGDELFHVIMLTNGALHYTSGEITDEPPELTGKWFLGDSIPSLEARMPDTIAGLMVANEVPWPAE